MPKASALIVTPLPISFLKKHPGAEVMVLFWIRIHGVESVGLAPVFVIMKKVGEVMETEPVWRVAQFGHCVAPPVLITGSPPPDGGDWASATAVDNTTN
jgi:hypothetical protein